MGVLRTVAGSYPRCWRAAGTLQGALRRRAPPTSPVRSSARVTPDHIRAQPASTFLLANALRATLLSHDASTSEGRQRLVAVTIAHAPSRRPPSASANVAAPSANSAPTNSSQTVATLNAWRRRAGLGGSPGPPVS